MSKNFSDQLRLALARSPLSLAELSRRTGLAKPTLSRFRRGKRMGLSTVAIDALVQALDLELVLKRKGN